MGRDLGYTEEGDETKLYYTKTFDAEGRLIAECKGSTNENNLYRYGYNAAGEVTQITDPEGGITNITLAGTAKTVEDAEHHSTAFEFEHLPGLQTSVTDAQGHVAAYTYDFQGRLTLVDYNNGARLHSFQYDRNDNLISETHPETGLITYTYNDEDSLNTKTWGDSTIHYVHNAQSGQLYSVYWGTYPSYEEEILYTHNTAGKVSRVRSTVKGWDRDQIQYDPYGNVIQEKITIPGLAQKTIQYEYDKFNRLSKTIYPDLKWSLAGSNGLAMPENLVFDDANNYLVSSATYGNGKAITGLSFARNGTQFSASYNASGMLAAASLTKNGVVLYDASYQYNGNGNILNISSTAPGDPTPLIATFGYDSLNRLTSATYNTGRVNTFAYTYDEYGNMRAVQENGISVFDKNYDVGNRIQGDSYDARGNVLAAAGENKLYHWDKQNQLAYVSNTAGEILGKYLYDERGLRLLAFPPLPEISVLKEPRFPINTGDVVVLSCTVNEFVDTTFIIGNEGDANLELTGSPRVAISGDVDQFSIAGEQPVSPILPSGTSSFTVRFSPTSIGKKTVVLSIANNDFSENPFTITLTGNLNPPEIQIADVPDGGSWDFGTVRVGQSQQWPFMIQNLGEEDLLISGNPRVEISGDGQEQFFVEQQPSGVITGGGYSFFIIRYSPTYEGQATAQISIQNNDSDENPYNYTLTGTGQGGSMLSAGDPELDITAPDGSETLVAGQTQAISWTGGGTTQFVRLEYSSDNGSTYATIAERAPNTGRFDWIVPADFSPVCLIRISDADGILATPQAYFLGFDMKISLPPEPGAAGSRLGIRVAIPDASNQTTRVADFAVSIEALSLAEKASLNLAKSPDLNAGISSGEWRHYQVTLDMDKGTGTVAIGGQFVLEDVPLTESSVWSDRPQLTILPNSGSSGKIWLDNLEVRYQDHARIIRTGQPDMPDRPIISDSFDRYSAGKFPGEGGWKTGLVSSAGEGMAAMAGVTDTPAAETKQSYDQGISAGAGTATVIDQSERVSPLGSIRFEKTSAGAPPIVKEFALPARLPYDVSRAGFAIVAQDTELADLMDKMVAERTQSPTATEVTQANQAGSLVSSSGAAAGSAVAMATMSTPRTGSLYIYTFDGRLLAEYDIYGNCLRDYIYIGSRLVAEYVPATGQYFFYMQDQISSTRVVTDDAGTVVYAEAHDPYGGIQKTWVNTFDPKRKFSDKERDGETGLDYFGARYYSAPGWADGHASGRYRWLSVDPLLIKRNNPNSPGHWNLYAFCLDNPLRYRDPTGREAEADHIINIFLDWDLSFSELDLHKLANAHVKGYKIYVHTVWTSDDLRKSAGATNTSTFFIGHSSLIPATGGYNGIITPSGSITTNDPIITNNRYIGIFACDSQSYIEALTTRKEGLFAIEGGGTEKGSHIEGYWDAVYVLIAQLITGHDPGEASRKATDRLIDRLGKEWHGEVFVWW